MKVRRGVERWREQIPISGSLEGRMGRPHERGGKGGRKAVDE